MTNIPWFNTSVSYMTTSVECVLILCILYFSISLISFTLNTLETLLETQFVTLSDSLSSNYSALSHAPIFSVLFLAARIRANSVTPNGAPQCFAQDGMRITVLSLTSLIMFNFIIGLCKCHRSKVFQTITLIIQWIATIGQHAGVGLVVGGILVITPDTASCPGNGSIFAF